MHQGAFGDAGLDDRSDRRLLDVGQHPDHHLAPALEQAQDRRLLLLQRAAARRTLQPPASAAAPLLATAAGLPLCPATTSTSSISTSPSRITVEALAASPCRRCWVMACTSETPRSSSLAICRLERLRPMK